MLLAAVTVGTVYLLTQWLRARRARTGLVWEEPDPVGPAARPAAARSASAPPAEAPRPGPAAWIEPVDGGCPPSHPVKAKLSSGIYHVPGGLSYARTRPDRCYRDAAAAEADGLRAARR